MHEDELKASIAWALGVDVATLDALIAKRRAAARARVERANARYARALKRVTDVQAVLVETLQQQGCTLQERIWINRASGNVALVLHKRCWDSQHSRLGMKLMVVYPDGSRSETFERKISIRENF